MGQKDPPRASDDAALKRLAQGVFLQLPSDLDEAEQVLRYMAELLKWHQGRPYAWLDADPGSTSDPVTGVLPFMKRG